MLVFILLLSEGQAGEAWKPFNKSMFFLTCRGTMDTEELSHSFCVFLTFLLVRKWNISKIWNVELLDETSHILHQQKNNTPLNNVLFPMTNDSFNSHQNFFFPSVADHSSGTSDRVPRLSTGPILELIVRYITYSLLSWCIACHKIAAMTSYRPINRWVCRAPANGISKLMNFSMLPTLNYEDVFML
jgi:hypothetical protein